MAGYNGANIELHADFMDLNGCDAFSYYGNGKSLLHTKMAWYDFQTSTLDAPSWDTESHITSDATKVSYDDIIEYYVGSDVWNGGVHGRGGQALWLWDMVAKAITLFTGTESFMIWSLK